MIWQLDGITPEIDPTAWVAPGAQDRSVATVRTLGSTQISTLRWILLAAVPGIILLAGVTFRALRG